MARRRVKNLKAPFLVTVSAVAALGAASCGGDVSSTDRGNPIEEGDSGAASGGRASGGAGSGGAASGGAASGAGGNPMGGSFGAGGGLPSSGGTASAGGSTGEGGSTQPSFEMCPGAEPAHGAPCNVDPVTWCSYPYCGSFTGARCVAGFWEHPVPTCNPPPPYEPCPTDIPAVGSACYTDPAEVCEYGMCVLDWTTQARCFVGAWQHRYPSCWDPGRDAPWVSADVDAGAAPGADG